MPMQIPVTSGQFPGKRFTAGEPVAPRWNWPLLGGLAACLVFWVLVALLIAGA
jgi:hypothetical protein